MSDWFAPIGAILAAVVGLAIVAVIVSKNANTSGVLTSAGQAFGGIIQAAVSPVSGTAASPTSQFGIGNLSTLLG